MTSTRWPSRSTASTRCSYPLVVVAKPPGNKPSILDNAGLPKTHFPLGTDLEPVAEVESKVVAARGAPKDQRKYCEQRGQGDEDEVATVSHAPIVPVARQNSVRH